MSEKILTSEEVAEIDRLISSGALQLPLRVEGWHKSLTDGGWLVRHDTGRTLATVEFVPVELETGRPALDGNAPARAIVALLNSIPALCATVRHLLSENERLTNERDNALGGMRRICTHPSTYPLGTASRRCHDCGLEFQL